MHTDATDRRRIAVATIITIVALPALWLSGRDDAGGGSNPIAVVGGSGALEAAGADVDTTEPIAEDSGVDAFASNDPVFLAGPSLPPPPEPSVVYADPGPARQVTGRATFRRWGPEWGGQACQSPAAPANARLVVTNVNNGRSVTCTNVLTRALPGGEILVLDTDTFLLLANLVEAPLPVSITW